MAKSAPANLTSEQDAGAVEHYIDAALYDLAYRHRRADINFYKMLAEERLSRSPEAPILELACGSGRLTLPLLRAGHPLVALDRSPAMLNAARKRVSRLPPARRNSCVLFTADMRAFALQTAVPFALAGFHSIQHLITDEDVLACFRCVRASLRDDGWFVFDVLPPHPDWLEVLGELRWSPRSFLHPTTGQRVRHGTSHSYDATTKALHMRLHYQPVDGAGRPNGETQVVRLCHRQFWPGDIDGLLDAAGFRILARYSDFDPAALESEDSLSTRTDEHIFIARPK